MFQILKSHFFDPRTIRDEQLELTFIDLKNKIVVTDGRDNELSYKHLYSRIELVLSRILALHERYAVEVESGTDVSSIADLFVEGQGPIWKTPVHYPNRKLRRDSIKPELLFYLCFFAYLGGQVRQIGEVRDDPDYAVQLLDYLISEREFAPALFLKGFILKYCG